MQTRREYLVELGLAKATRGKLSKDAHAAIDKAIAGGMQFSDMQDRPVVIKRVKKDVPQEEDAFNKYADGLIVYRNFDTQFKGVDSKGKTHKVTARSICFNSSYSIAGCACGNHRALVNSLEVIPVAEV